MQETMIDQAIIDKASKIRLLICDVDGVLTDGRLYFSAEEIHQLAFHVRDGVGLQILIKQGIEVAIITTATHNIIDKRAEWLGIKRFYKGCEDKRAAFQDLLSSLQLSPEQVAYVGDDFPDLPIIQAAGLGIAVADATAIVREAADWVTARPGGHGAVREVCELLLHAQHKWEKVVAQYAQ